MTDVNFAFVSARAERHAAAPTLVLRVQVQVDPGVAVTAGLLRCQLFLDVRRRRYSAGEGARLSEIFSDRTRWDETLRPLLWTTAPLILPGFEGQTEVDLPVACTYDFEVASTKYFHALEDGEVPVLMLFNGTLFLAGETGFQVAQVPWEKEARFRLPVSTWREAMDQHFKNTAWVRLSRESFDALDRFRTQRGLMTWDQAVDALCDGAAARQTVERV
jgi:hypothetical protein